MSDVEGIVRTAIAANDRAGGKPVATGRARLVSAGLQHPVAPVAGQVNETFTERGQKRLNAAIPYRPSTGALQLLIDSTGIKAEGEGEWFANKHGPSKPRQRRKVHLGIDADTLEIRAIEVTGS